MPNVRLTRARSVSDIALVVLVTLASGLWIVAVLVPDPFVDLAILFGFPVILVANGVAWYTSLKAVPKAAYPRASALVWSVMLSLITFFGFYVSSLILLVPIVGILSIAGSDSGLSYIRAGSAVPLSALLVLGLVVGG